MLEELEEIERARFTRRPATEAVHAGEIESRPGSQPVSQPIYQTTVHSFESIEALEHYYEAPESAWLYYREGNPNQSAFESAMARLEGAEAATTCGSGMGAIFAALSAVLQSGDHLIVDNQVYGGTFALLSGQMPRYGIETSFVDFSDQAALRAAVRPTTRLLLFETLTNPLIQVTDLPAVIALARELNLLTFVDATFSTPVLCRPLDWGADIVLHATTKYIGGHSDALGGIVAGKRSIVQAAQQAAKVMGLVQGSFDAWLNVRSLKTLPLRMEAHSRNARSIAQWLERHSAVTRVYYPGLESNPQHQLACQLMPHSMFGGMLAFELQDGMPAVRRLVKNLHQIALVPSLADVTTTLSHPAGTSHRMHSPEQRAKLGIADGLLRLSAGIEELADILEDLDQALKQ